VLAIAAIPGAAASGSSMELLERESCLADLAKWLSTATQHAGCAVLLGGEAGIGKTALLREFARRQNRARVLWGACDALFTPRPLAPLADVALQTQGLLLAAINSRAPAGTLFAAALAELQREATLLVFEDMHWADEATLDLLTFLGRRMDRTRTLLVASYRDDELGDRHPLRFVIGGLPREATFRMALAPLSEAAVVRLAQQVGRPSKDLHSITGGNPLFVTEVLAAAVDTVPPTVRDAVLARAARLSPAARALAELVCVVPGRAESWLLEQAAQPDEAAIEGCLRIGMVRHDDWSLAFRHELARRAMEDALPQPRRQQLHARVLEVLAARSDIPAARLAHHADGARNGLKSLHYAPLAAAHAAAVGAHREAAAHYEAALRYAEQLSPGERARLLERRFYECFLTGDYQPALEALRAALDLWRMFGQTVKEGDALGQLSRLSWFLGDTAQAKRYCLDAIATLEPLTPGAELASAYSNWGDLALETHDADTAIEYSQRAIALAETVGRQDVRCDSLITLGTMRLIVGDSSGWADLNQALQVALASGLQEQVASSYTNMAAMAVSRRQYEQAAGYLSAGLTYCEEHDLDFLLLYLLAYRARLRFEQDDWNGASEDVGAVLRHPRCTPITRIPALRTLAHLRVRRGDPDVEGPVRQARELAGPAPELQREGMLALVCAEAAWLAGEPERMVREVLPVYELARHTRDPRMNGELAAWLWRAGSLAHRPIDVAEPYALEISGDWQGAATAWRLLGCRYEHANLLALYGGEADQRQALAIFEQLGAGPAARSLRRQMRVRGVRRIPRGVRTSTRRNAFGLTERESQILSLLLEGLRTSLIAKRLFIAPKTVEHHVSAILTKLGVSSRAEAVALVRKQAE
jgi:DNA-binding CsgD family transcriptional regulator/tetratricopeptide (TPR) repeat protein